MKPHAATGLLLFVALLAPGPAGAQQLPKGKKTKSMVKVQAVQTLRTRVEPAAARRPSARPSRLLNAEQFHRQVRSRLGQLTSRAMAVLQRLIRVTEEDDPQKPDYYFRLAEHCREKKVQYMFRARELDERIHAARTASARERLRALQRQYEVQERRWLKRALTRYLQIVAGPRYAHYKRMDEVLFNAADLLNRAGRRDRARVVFGRLIRDHPRSRYIADAYLSFAEYYFNQGQVAEALKLYQQVSRHHNTPLFGYALYKQGWCWLNLKDPRRALEMFVRVVRHGGGRTGPRQGRIVLVREALKDSVRAYVHVGRHDRAWQFFVRLNKARAPRMLQQLARLYFDQGKFLRATAVYHELIKRFPRSKQLCAWQYQVVRATLPGKDKQAQARECQRLATLHRAFLARVDVKRTMRSSCTQDTAGILRELATTWHREAQVTRDQETYTLAGRLYGQYLKQFPRARDHETLSYYLAELLFATKKWRESARAYARVVKLNSRGKHASAAAYAEVVAWRNVDHIDRVASSTSNTTRIPFSADQQRMVEAFERYLHVVPRGPERVQVLYRLARIYYVHNHHDTAVRLFARVVTKHASHALAQYAANLLLDSLNIQGKHRQLERWVDRLLADRRLSHGHLRKTLDELKLGVRWKRCEALRKAGKFRPCGEQFAALANDYPDNKRWPEMLFNSAHCFEAAKLIGHAIGLRNKLIAARPEHPLAQKALYMVGANYHALAWYSRAADYYERYARKFPGAKQAPEALQNALIFRIGRQEQKQASAAARLFEKSYGARRRYAGRVAAVQFSLGLVHQQRGDTDAVVRHYRRYLTRWGRHGGIPRRVLAHVNIGRALWASACSIKPIHGACIRVQRLRSRRRVVLAGRRGAGRRARIELRTQCGPPTKMKVTVVPRARGRARAAQRHFRKALELHRRLSKGTGTAARHQDRGLLQKAHHAAAAARFFQAEAQLERFLGLAFPRRLDFSRRNKVASERRFLRYLKHKDATLQGARKAYQEVIKMRQAHWAIASSARIGQLYQNFADALYTATIPRPTIPRALTSREGRLTFIETFNQEYCARLETVAYPLEQRAEQGLAACLRKSTQLSWYNAWSRLCEAELNQIKPSVYHLAAEIRARPNHVGIRAGRVGLVKAFR